MPERICQLADNRLREGTPESGARAAPARGFANRSRAVPGIMLSGTTAGVWGASTGLGQARAGNARRTRVPGSLAWS